jgi:hypothetical protein
MLNDAKKRDKLTQALRTTKPARTTGLAGENSDTVVSGEKLSGENKDRVLKLPSR